MQKKTKRCSKCQEVKNLSEFSKDKYKKSGYTSSCKKCRNAYKWAGKSIKYSRKKQAEWKQKNPIRFRHHQYRVRYGITIDDYNKMFNEQRGHCAICGVHQSALKKKLHVDHSHKTGQIRGLLCGKCNLCLGLLHDDIAVLKDAIKYLEKI